ncbi:MAG TPA: hypothetical protein VK066_15210 [Chloroflexota bacterium]|nr:hypothetical protein [Chloroflexota bacterium]
MRGEQGPRGTIAVVAGSAIVGEALALLLQGLGYRARFAAPRADTAWPLADCQLVVLAPGLSASQRAALLAAVRGAAAPAAVPVLELTRDDAPPGDAPCVHWPCRAEELARAIDAALAPRVVEAAPD